jgi:hypothetical protein
MTNKKPWQTCWGFLFDHFIDNQPELPQHNNPWSAYLLRQPELDICQPLIS